MKKTIYTLVTFVFLATTFTACKKDKNAPAKPNCNITTITGATNSIAIAYNSDNKIATLTNGTSVSTYAYSSNTIVITTLNSGTFSQKKIITIGTNGLATNIRIEKNSAGTSFSNTTYEYNGSEILRSTRTSSVNSTSSVTNYTFSGGNLVSISSGGSTTTLEYFTNIPSQKGDYFNLTNLIDIGADVFISKNALKSIISSSVSSIDYGFDAEGKINKLTQSGASSSIINYSYTCK